MFCFVFPKVEYEVTSKPTFYKSHGHPIHESNYMYLVTPIKTTIPGPISEIIFPATTTEPERTRYINNFINLIVNLAIFINLHKLNGSKNLL